MTVEPLILPPGDGAPVAPLTVGELRQQLAGLDDDLPVEALYDCRFASGSVVAVEQGETSRWGGLQHSVLLVID